MISTNLTEDNKISGRIEWIDAMRGFSMIIVVLGHVLHGMGVGGYHSFLSSLLLTFRMPLFFFVSGYFSYRSIGWWNKTKLCDILKRKVQAQIICTIVFCTLFQYVMSYRFDDIYGGYWFTIVLFQMYIIYLAVSFWGRAIKRDLTVHVMLLLSVIAIGIMAKKPFSGFIWILCCGDSLCRYFQFFTVGIIAAKYKDVFFALLSKNSVITASILAWTVCMILWYSTWFQNFSSLCYSLVHDILVRYAGLITVVSVFYHHRDFFSGHSRCAFGAKYIGRRTLDIYMLHFFFLPNIGDMIPWIGRIDMISLQIIISVIFTVVILSLCLVISGILRESRTLSMWLFGMKPSKAS